MQNEIINIENAAIKYYNGTWLIYNVSDSLLHMVRIGKNGKPASFKGGLAKTNLLNITPAQYAEIKAAN